MNNNPFRYHRCIMTVHSLHLGIAAFALISCQFAAAQAVLSKQVLFEAPGRNICQGTSLVESDKGTILAAWRVGSEKGPDGEAWLARFEGGRWTMPKMVATGVQSDGQSFRCSGVILFPAAGGELLLQAGGPRPGGGSWDDLWVSHDDGTSWEKQLPKSGANSALRPGNPVRLKDGTVICASSTENEGWRLHFDRSTDGGKSWTTIRPASMGNPLVSAIAPAILQLNDDTLLALARSKNRRIAAVSSMDRGRSWGHVFLTSLPNPSSSLDALTLQDGRHVVVYNHSERQRNPLNVAVSSNGTDWEPWVTLENEPGLEFSFPSVIQTRDGLVHITYTYGVRTVKHAVIDLRESSGESIASAPLPPIQTDPNQPRIEVIRDQGPNAVEWALAPLEEPTPPNIRQNLTYLREDLLDEAKAGPKAPAEAYTLGSDYCDKILAALRLREQARVQAGYRAAQADADIKVTNSQLDARRNYQMSWPQYHREESQRAALREQETNKADLKKEKVKVEWAARADQMRVALDAGYRQFREAMR